MSSSPTEYRLRDYLAHMAEAAQLAQTYCSQLTFTQFLQDKKTQQAVLLNLLVIGEAVAKIAAAHPEFLDEHPEIPWKSIRGMRNRLAHGYFDVNLDTVWETVQSALPTLEQALGKIQNGLP